MNLLGDFDLKLEINCSLSKVHAETYHKVLLLCIKRCKACRGKCNEYRFTLAFCSRKHGVVVYLLVEQMIFFIQPFSFADLSCYDFFLRSRL